MPGGGGHERTSLTFEVVLVKWTLPNWLEASGHIFRMRSLKADSHIACRAHAAPMPCRWGFRTCLSHLIYTVRPCLIHTRHAITMPRPCHALTMPFFSRPRHGTARHGTAQHSTAVERRPVSYLPAFGFFRLPRGVPRRFLSEAYQSSSQRSMPTSVKSGSSTLQKKTICYTVGLAVRIFPATTRTITKDNALSEHGRGAAWQGNGMGTACYVWICL